MKNFFTFARQLNLNKLKYAARVWSSDKTGRELVSLMRNVLIEVYKSPNQAWEPQQYLAEGRLPKLGWESKILFTCHIYYEEYVPRFIDLVKKYPPEMKFAVTTPKREIKDTLDNLRLPNLNVVMSQNRGRNFGPLLVELAPSMKNFEYIVHLHSKKSKHTSKSLSRAWSDSHWNLLGGNPELLCRLVALFDYNEDLVVGYPLVTDLIGSRNFGWLGNLEQAREWHEKHLLDFPKGPFAFPAGGMFLIRRSAYDVLLKNPWSYEDFPLEDDQIDGTTQHLIERLVGSLPISRGGRHAIYMSKCDSFSSDTTFVSHS